MPSVAGYAPAAIRSARSDPTRATPTITSSSPTIRPFNDRSRVLKHMMDAGGSALLLLRAGLQGHGSQHERPYSQSHSELSHQSLLLFAGLAKRKSETKPLYAIPHEQHTSRRGKSGQSRPRELGHFTPQIRTNPSELGQYRSPYEDKKRTKASLDVPSPDQRRRYATVIAMAPQAGQTRRR